MRRIPITVFFALLMIIGVPAVYGQQSSDDGAQIKTREELAQLLSRVGPSIKVAFRQSQKQPFTFVGLMNEGLTTSESLEIVISVSAKQTIHFRIYPRYKGGYINVNKAKNGVGLMRQLLQFSNQNFLFWGTDDTADVFAGYTFTLESGFPDAALTIVLRSISNLDQFVGDMKPAIEGSSAIGQ